jgi:Domain of unknown function (DUF397)
MHGAKSREVAVVESEEPKRAVGTWRKSSYSTYNGNCLEMAILGNGKVGVRDSKDRLPGRRVLTFSPVEWSEFLTVIRAGEPGLR